MVGDKDGKTIACSKCYDEAVRLRARSWKGGPDRVISRHQCADCGTEVTTYVEDDKAMTKCGNCAPEGVACDLCAPASHGGS